MKKIILTITSVCFGFGLFAQSTPTTEVVQSTPLTQRGFKILPEAGDYAIGIDAAPFFRFIGNSFNGTNGNQAPWFGNDGITDLTIRGKYFLENDRAIRVTLGLTTGSTVHKRTVQDDYASSQSGYNGQTVIDVLNQKRTDIDLTVGYEFRRGYRRVQGFYGGEVGINFSSGKDVYTYANEITQGNTTPSTGNFGTNIAISGARTLERKNGMEIGLSLGGFAGVEYFIASKVSIGGEIGLGLGLSNKWQDEIKTETWNGTDNAIRENSVRELTGRTGQFQLNTITNGNLFLIFHF